jgi:rod shape-determining protein MreC
MRSLLNFLARYNNLIIFLILEGFSVYFLATRNSYHNARVLFGVRRVIQGVDERLSNAVSYLSLRDVNRSLSDENVTLKNSIERLVRSEASDFYSVSDSVYKQQYIHTSAEVIDNSINRQKNFFTINKGLKQGITKDMAVTTGNGVAGVIVGCSDNFSIAMSLLNLDFRLSTRIKSNGYYGSLSWDGRDYRNAILSEIPQHVQLSVGDTVETTGYSAIFPEGIMIGTISGFEKLGGDFYKITILLVTDFKKLRFVDVIGNMRKAEQLELQNSFQ